MRITRTDGKPSIGSGGVSSHDVNIIFFASQADTGIEFLHVFYTETLGYTQGNGNLLRCAVHGIDIEDYEVSYSYQIIPGADPMVTLTRYDSEYDYEQVYTNYQLMEML